MEQRSATGTRRARARLRWLFLGGLVLAAGFLLWYSGVEAGLWQVPAPALLQGAPLAEPPVPTIGLGQTAEAAAALPPRPAPPSAAQGTTLYLPVLSVGLPVSAPAPTRPASPGASLPAAETEVRPSALPPTADPTNEPAATAAAGGAPAEPDAPTGRWIWPVQGRISQPFSPGHRAIDVVADHGTLVRSADAGRVVYARWEISGYGYLVIVDHGDGYRSYYGHLYGFYVDVGQEVERGDLLGQLGNTGHSTGPHLHFEIRYLGSHLDPLDVLPARSSDGGQ